MKKNKLKNSITMIVIGILIGLLIATITKQLSMTYIFMFIALLVLMIIGISIIMSDDFDIKLIKAYEQGRCSNLSHMNCRHTFLPKESHACSCDKHQES